MPELRVSLHSFLLSEAYVVQWAYYGPFRPLKVQRQRGEEARGPAAALVAPCSLARSPDRRTDGRTDGSFCSWQFLPPRNARRNAPAHPSRRRPLS